MRVSRARVSQVLRPLSLAPEVMETIATLGDPLPSPIVTERRLRSIVNLPPEEQRRRVEAILGVGKAVRPKIGVYKMGLDQTDSFREGRI